MYMRNHGKFLAMNACKIDFINSTVFTKRKITETHILRLSFSLLSLGPSCSKVG